MLCHGFISRTARRCSAARFNGDNGRYMRRVAYRFPARSAALGMGHEDGLFPRPVVDFINGSSDGLCDNIRINGLLTGGVIHARIRCHLPEELVQGRFSFGELGVLIICKGAIL